MAASAVKVAADPLPRMLRADVVWSNESVIQGTLADLELVGWHTNALVGITSPDCLGWSVHFGLVTALGHSTAEIENDVDPSETFTTSQSSPIGEPDEC